MMLAGSPGGVDAERATRILRSAERMQRLLDDLLDLTRIRLGSGLDVVRAPMDLGATCRETVEEAEAANPGRTLRFEPSGDLRGEWDAGRLAQVVSNLVVNALTYGDPAAPVAVSARDDGDHVVLAIHNEGSPIPARDMERIFQPLVRSETEAEAGSHLGLGLFIVREIVAAHRGDIRVASTDAQGTTFTVRMPRASAPKT